MLPGRVDNQLYVLKTGYRLKTDLSANRFTVYQPKWKWHTLFDLVQKMMCIFLVHSVSNYLSNYKALFITSLATAVTGLYKTMCHI